MLMSSAKMVIWRGHSRHESSEWRSARLKLAARMAHMRFQGCPGDHVAKGLIGLQHFDDSNRQLSLSKPVMR
jgi:hypothetical protein